MSILTGRAQGIRIIALGEYAFTGTLTDYAKGWNLEGINTKYMFIFISLYRYVNTIFTTNRYIYT
jgi:hypothetical protein